MGKKKKNTFVFNDQSIVNSYGFSISTQGIDLSRFSANPIMLDAHSKDNTSVLGKWENVEKKDTLLVGSPLFDSTDQKVAVIEGKVERGFINSCSMGISFDSADLHYKEGQLILEKCELTEVSIVAIPSNANALRLYTSQTGELLNQEQIQELCLSACKEKKQNSIIHMKITLTPVAAIALGFAGTDLEHDMATISEHIVKLEAQKKASELKLSAVLEIQEAEKLQAVNTQVEAALKLGKITAENKQKFIELGIANTELLSSTLASIPAKKNFSEMVDLQGEATIKTVEDFQKLSFEAQLDFKQSEPAQYQKLFTKK